MNQTRAQQDLILAERLVSAVSGKPEDVKNIYGGLCHQFPVLVLTCGLCQALAFSEDKSAGKSGRGEAHKLLLEHVGELLGGTGALAAVRTGSAADYMRHTRRVLGAWVYFKRFAVSILKVEAADAKDGED